MVSKSKSSVASQGKSAASSASDAQARTGAVRPKARPSKRSVKSKTPADADAASTAESKATESAGPGQKSVAASKKGAQALNAQIETLAAQANSSAAFAVQVQPLLEEKGKESLGAADLVAAVAAEKPEWLVPIVDKLTQGIVVGNKRIAGACAVALPAVTRVAPARVAKHLDKLKKAFSAATPAGQDGLVNTFAALCTASVAYQKRLESVLGEALASADGKVLLRWTEVVLPALKGEPHARARSVVEERLLDIPRPLAQKIADFLGIKLRPQAR